MERGHASAGSSSCWRRAFGSAPTTCFATCPFLNRIRVGIDMIPYLAAVSGFSSTFIFTTVRSSRSLSSSSRCGAMIRQGPHQGAQKSTSTGWPAPSTSAAKLVSVTSVRLPANGISPSETIGCLQKISTAPTSQRRHFPHCFERDPCVHLGFSHPALPENDRDLDNAEAGLDCAVCELDLEAIAVRMDRVQVESLEDGAPEALEAAGEVAHVEPENCARVPGAAAADESPQQSPVGHGAARDVAGAQHQVGAVLGRRDQPWQVGGVVREVRVHFEHQVGSACERVLEAGQVGAAEALLAGAVEHRDRIELACELVGDRAGAVGELSSTMRMW